MRYYYIHIVMTQFFLKYKILFLLLMFCYANTMQAQQSVVRYNKVDSLNPAWTQVNLQSTFVSAEEAYNYIKSLPSYLSTKGFIASSVDSIIKDSFNYTADVFLGEKFSWANLYVEDSLLPVLSELRYNSNDFKNQIYNADKVEKLYQDIIQYYSSRGYPFVKAGLTDISLQNNIISGKLTVDKGYIYNLDSIIVHGNANISQFYIHKYLDIEPHQPYNASKLAEIDRKLNNISYLKQTLPWEVQMTSGGAVLNLYLDKQSVNEIDAIVGFNAGENPLDRKLRLTGQVKLNLRNAFGGAEFIAFNWQQLRTQSPRLNLAFSKPYIFRSNFGVDVGFNMYKFDSAYVNIDGFAGVSYSFSSQQSVKLLVNNASSRMISVDTNQVIATKRLPAVMDMSMINGELVYLFNNTDYLINPRRGTDVLFSVAAGTRKIKRSNAIMDIADENFDYSTLYDTVKTSVYQIKAQADAAHYFPVGRQAVVKTAVNAGILYSADYYMNELFQIGGYRLLRGFNEESIFANQYVAGTVEYRFLFAQNSYFFGFADGGWRNLDISSIQQQNTYISGGVGMAFQTRAGIFNLAIANGKTSGEPFRFNQSKIHIGYTALF